MYWYRYYLIALSLAAILFNYGCSAPVNAKPDKQYFDIKQFFELQAAGLTTYNQPIIKTVTYNGTIEAKKVSVKNWPRELDAFISSDINKPAWRNSYKVDKGGDSVIYTAIDTTLRTRRISIRSWVSRTDVSVASIIIDNITKNPLYQTHDKLTYSVGGFYRIQKHQSVKLLGSNDYTITGKFK